MNTEKYQPYFFGSARAWMAAVHGMLFMRAYYFHCLLLSNITV